MAKLIAITGGIGSGKTVVAEILRSLSYPVYDCDSEAKRIMDNSPEIHSALCRHIHPKSVLDGIIDRKLISQIVFNDAEALTRLNSIVHTAVKEDLALWVARQVAEGRGLQFVESAILISSGLINNVDEVWMVVAPEDLRIERVKNRNNLPVEAIKARMEAQAGEFIYPENKEVNYLTNDGLTALLSQIHKILDGKM